MYLLSIAYVPSIVLGARDKGMNRTDQVSDFEKINVMGVGEEKRGKSQHQIIKQLNKKLQLLHEGSKQGNGVNSN